MNRLTGILKGKCPKCGQGHIFETAHGISKLGMPAMKKNCEHCGHLFEKESGFFWGAMFVSYAMAVIEIVAVFLICQLFFKDMFDDRIIWVIGASIVGFSTFNFRYARVIWIYIFTSKNFDI
jgi:uncharacterized protein (DUF983 family)